DPSPLLASQFDSRVREQYTDVKNQASGRPGVRATEARMGVLTGLDPPTLGGLHQDPTLAREADLEALARAHPDQALRLDLGLQRRRDSARPGDRRLRIRESGRATHVELYGLAVRDE